MSASAPIVLVVDARVTAARYLSETLGEDGYEVVHHPRADDALRLARERPPVLVVIDGDDEAGRSLARALRGDDALRAIPQVLLVERLDAAGLSDHWFEPAPADLSVRRPLSGGFFAERLTELLPPPPASTPAPPAPTPPAAAPPDDRLERRVRALEAALQRAAERLVAARGDVESAAAERDAAVAA